MGGRSGNSNNQSNQMTGFGSPGVYKLYRAGRIDFKDDDYPVFFAKDESYAREYGYDSKGNKRNFGEYEVTIKNPLVINIAATDASTVYANFKEGEGFFHKEQSGPMLATNKLFGTNFNPDNKKDLDKFLNHATTKAGRARAQGNRDQAIMKEAIRRGYDAVIYRFDKPMNVSQGRKLSTPKSKDEVLIPAGKLRRRSR